MADRPQALFSKQLRLSRSTLFLDVYAGREAPYLQICESRKDKEGKWVRTRLFLQREAVSEVKNALREVEDFFLSDTPQLPNRDDRAMAEAERKETNDAPVDDARTPPGAPPTGPQKPAGPAPRRAW